MSDCPCVYGRDTRTLCFVRMSVVGIQEHHIKLPVPPLHEYKSYQNTRVFVVEKQDAYVRLPLPLC